MYEYNIKIPRKKKTLLSTPLLLEYANIFRGRDGGADDATTNLYAGLPFFTSETIVPRCPSRFETSTKQTVKLLAQFLRELTNEEKGRPCR